MARYPRQGDPFGENVLPSVTEIIGELSNKQFLIQWASNMAVKHNDAFAHKKHSEEAMEIGSEIHHWIENKLRKMLRILSRYGMDKSC